MSAVEQRVTATFVEWLCAARYDEFPDAVRSKAADVVFDAVGAMSACSTLPEVQAIVRLIMQCGGHAHCSIIGHPLTTSVVNAALAHGGMAHGDEVDPVHV